MRYLKLFFSSKLALASNRINELRIVNLRTVAATGGSRSSSEDGFFDVCGY